MMLWIRHILAQDGGDDVVTIVAVIIAAIFSLIASLSKALTKSRQKREQQKRGIQPAPQQAAPKPSTVNEFLEQIKRIARGEDASGTRGEAAPGMPPSGPSTRPRPEQPLTLRRPAPPPPPRPAAVLPSRRPGAPPLPPRPTPLRPAALRAPRRPSSPFQPVRPTPVAPAATPQIVEQSPESQRREQVLESLPSITRVLAEAGLPPQAPKAPTAPAWAPPAASPERSTAKRPSLVTAAPSKPAAAPDAKTKALSTAKPALSGSPAELRAALRQRLAAGPAALREAVLLSEVLGQPISLRRRHFRRPGLPGRLF